MKQSFLILWVSVNTWTTHYRNGKSLAVPLQNNNNNKHRLCRECKSELSSSAYLSYWRTPWSTSHWEPGDEEWDPPAQLCGPGDPRHDCSLPQNEAQTGSPQLLAQMPGTQTLLGISDAHKGCQLLVKILHAHIYQRITSKASFKM